MYAKLVVSLAETPVTPAKNECQVTVFEAPGSSTAYLFLFISLTSLVMLLNLRLSTITFVQ